MLHLGVTQEWVDEGRLPKERTKSKVEETLRCIGRGHTWRVHNSSLFHKDQNAMEMSPGGDMVQRIVVGQFMAMRYTRQSPVRDEIIWRYDRELLEAPLR